MLKSHIPDVSLKLALYRNIVSSNVKHALVLNSSNYLKSQNSEYTKKAIKITDDTNRSLFFRCTNALFCYYAAKMGVLELSNLNTGGISEEILDETFKSNRDSVFDLLKSVEKYGLESLSKVVASTSLDIDQQTLSTSESIVFELVKAFANCIRGLLESCKTLGIIVESIQELSSQYYADIAYLEKSVSMYNQIMNTNRTIDQTSMFSTYHVTVDPHGNAKWGLIQSNLSILLMWQIDKLNRFYALKNIADRVSKNNILLIKTLYREHIENPNTAQSNLAQFATEKTSKWLSRTRPGKLRLENLTYFISVAAYILCFADEIVFSPMITLKKKLVATRNNLSKLAQHIYELSVEKPNVIKKGTEAVNMYSLVNKVYKYIVRSCHFVSMLWSFDYLSPLHSDPEWVDQLEYVKRVFTKSLGEVNYDVVRAGIKYKIKPSNIPNAGLGIFFDEDITANRFIGSQVTNTEFGVPLFVYDGEFMDQDKAQLLYGGAHSLRPYSVGTGRSDEKSELNAYHPMEHDVARFINDCFNRLPEIGKSPDTTNANKDLRTFRYNTRMTWTLVSTTENNDKTIESIRKSKKITTSEVMESNKYKLVVYTVPLEQIASTEPEILFKKGQELWLSYGRDYIKRLGKGSTLKNIDYSPEEKVGFISGRKSVQEIAFQEKFIELISMAPDKQETYRDTIFRMTIANKILSTRPYNASESYYSFSLNEVCNYALEWLLAETSNDLKSILKSRIFDHKKIDADINVLDGDVPIDTLVSILVAMATCYKACIYLSEDKRNQYNYDDRLNDEEDCRERSKRERRVTEQDTEIFVKVSRIMDTLVATCKSWHLKSVPLFDSEIWEQILFQFRIDLDTFMISLDLNWMNPDSFGITKKIIKHMDIAKGVSNIQELAMLVYRSVHSADPSSYLRDVEWLSNEEKMDAETVKRLEQIFTAETKEFLDSNLLRMNALANDKGIEFFNFLKKNSINTAQQQEYRKAIVQTAWAYITHKRQDIVVDVKTLLLLAKSTFKKSVKPEWTFEKRGRDAYINYVSATQINVQESVSESKKKENKPKKSSAPVVPDTDVLEDSSILPLNQLEIYNVSLQPSLSSKSEPSESYAAMYVQNSYEMTAQLAMDSRNDGIITIDPETKSKIQRAEPKHEHKKKEKKEKHEHSSANKAKSDGTRIELDFTIDLAIKLGPRFEDDTLSRHGFVVEGWVSRSVSPNFANWERELLKQTGDKIPNQSHVAIFDLVQEEYRVDVGTGSRKYVYETVDPNHCTIGLLIKGLVYPSESGQIASSKLKRDYDGECYIPIYKPGVVGQEFDILCKIYDMSGNPYKTIGKIKVNRLKIGLEKQKFTREYSESVLKNANVVAKGAIDRFFDRYNNDSMKPRPGEKFLENKHTPIWPNTPLEKMPSSMFVLNAPSKESAKRGSDNFSKSLSIILETYGLSQQAFLRSLKRVLRTKKEVLSMGNTKTSGTQPELYKEILEVIAVVRLICEAITLVPILADYRPDFTRTGEIGENYGEGLDGMIDCEDVGKLCKTLIKCFEITEFDATDPLHYIKKILDCYVPGMIGCSSSKKAAREVTDDDDDISEDYQGYKHINHVLAGMIKKDFFYKACKKSEALSSSGLRNYSEKKMKSEYWLTTYLPQTILEGTGNTMGVNEDCTQYLHEEYRVIYADWAAKVLSTQKKILVEDGYSELTELAFQDNPVLKTIGKSQSASDRIRFSNFYTKIVHFWTDELISEKDKATSDFNPIDFLFCTSQGQKGKWYYGVNFKDYLDCKNEIAMYPILNLTDNEMKVLKPIATEMAYPPLFLNITNDKRELIDTFGSAQRTEPVILKMIRELEGEQTARDFEVCGVLSQTVMVAYLNHSEYYTPKKREEIQSLVSSSQTIGGCSVYKCSINGNTEMVQFVFYLK